MDNFELKTEPKNQRKPVIWNILTVIVLLGACGLAYFFLTIYQNPAMLPARFQPAALPTAYQTPTPTATIILQPATWTPTLTTQPSATRTRAPTWTSVAALISPTITMTPTDTPMLDTATITPTAMPASADITYLASTTKHPDLACKWMGVGGTVTDVNNKPLLFQTIQVGGTLNGKAVTGQVLSGNNPAYGTSGFEIKLADSAIDSSQTLWIQLFDNNGKALTEKTPFDTFNDCQKNLIMIKFTLSR
jgi:hypothetical protein